MIVKRALFLCSGNYYRSRFAEELFNHRARRDGLSWRASSRGLRTSCGVNVGPISALALEALRARNVTPSTANMYPITCTIADLESADQIVGLKEAEHRQLLSARFPGWEDRVTFWHVHDIGQGSPKEAMDTIDRQVEDMILDIKQGKS
jgi:protein-tyrosine phosphatase